MELEEERIDLVRAWSIQFWENCEIKSVDLGDLGSEWEAYIRNKIYEYEVE